MYSLVFDLYSLVFDLYSLVLPKVSEQEASMTHAAHTVRALQTQLADRQEIAAALSSEVGAATKHVHRYALRVLVRTVCCRPVPSRAGRRGDGVVTSRANRSAYPSHEPACLDVDRASG